MTIKKPVKITDMSSSVDAFIGAAPDAGKPKPTGVIRGKKLIITVGFSPEMLKRIDAAALNVGISRAAWINLACSRAITNGL